MGPVAWTFLGIVLFALVVAVLGRVYARHSPHRAASDAGYAVDDHGTPRPMGPAGTRADVERSDQAR